MARSRFDGSYQSANTPTYQNIGGYDDTSVYRCLVTAVKFVDSPDNITQKSPAPRVLYDCIVLGGFKAGQPINNCRVMTTVGNNFNYYEKILKPTSKKFPDERLSEHDGDIVFVQFIQGKSSFPVIIGVDNGIKPNKAFGAKKEDGLRELREFNGIYENIDKDGVHTFKRFGGEYNAETLEFTVAEEAEYTRTIEKEEVVTETFKSGLTIKKDGMNDKITQTFKSGLVIETDGTNDKASVTTSGGVSMEVDGKGNKITLTAGSTVIEIDGASGKVSLKGDFVDIGASPTDFAVLFTSLLTAFNSHIHLVPQAPAGTLPSNPPTVPLLQTVGSTSVKIQD